MAPALLDQAGGQRDGELRERPPLRVNFGWTLAGNVVYSGCQWFLLVVLARLANQAAVGRLALASAIATPIFVLTALQLRGSVATDAAGLFRFPDYFGVRVSAALLALVATVVVVAVAGYDRATALVVLAVGLTKAVDTVADIHYGFLQKHERMEPIARSLIMRAILNVIVVGAVVWAGGGLALAVLAFTLSSVAVLLAYDVRNVGALLTASAQTHLPRFHPSTMRRIVATSLPLGLVGLAVSLRTYIPRFFVESRFGTAELGTYAVLSSFIAAGTLIISALGQSSIPRLSQHFWRGELVQFRRLLTHLLLLALGVGTAGIVVSAVAGRLILRLVFGSAYADRVDVLVWLMAGGLLGYATSFLGYALTAARRFKVQLPLFAATTLACAAACWFLVPKYGLLGAAWAWGAALVLEFAAARLVLEIALWRRARS